MSQLGQLNETLYQQTNRPTDRRTDGPTELNDVDRTAGIRHADDKNLATSLRSAAPESRPSGVSYRLRSVLASELVDEGFVK